MWSRICGVIGSLRDTESPKERRMPLRREVRVQLSRRGLGRPASRCSNLMMFRYWRMEENRSRLARYAAYRHTVTGDKGTGGQPSSWQNCM